jgi:hypothetical protein
VKDFPMAVKFLTILGVLRASVIAATNEVTTRMCGLTAGFLAGAWLFMADGAASKPAMLGRWSCGKSMVDSALDHAASVLPARVAAFCGCGDQHSIVSTN